MTNEEFYDAEIAPALKELCRKCQEKGMAFCASVEYDPPNAGRGRTEWHPGVTPTLLVSLDQLLVHWAARCNGNVDALFNAIDRFARVHGHGSIVLLQMGNNNINYDRPQAAAITVIQPGD